MKRLWLTCLVLVLLLGASLSVQAQGNLLVDPGFEGETYVLVSVAPEDGVQFSVPQGWGGGTIRQPATESWMNKQPTGFPHFGSFVWSGRRSFHMARGFSTFTAYVYQQVSVVQGTEVYAGAKAFIENRVSSAVRVGIDPNGGANPFDGDVVWSNWWGSLNAWNFPEVRTRSTGTVATIFLFATQSQPSDPNGVYWDDAFLLGAAGSGVINPSPSQPQPSTSQYVLSNTRLSVRAGAGTSFNRLGIIDPGDTYPLVETLPGWYGIDYGGQKGYVSSQFSRITDTPSSGGGGGSVPQVEFLDFTANYALRIRTQPDANSAEVGRLPYPSIARAYGRNSSNTHVFIDYNGVTGWVPVRYGVLNGNIRGLPVR